MTVWNLLTMKTTNAFFGPFRGARVFRIFRGSAAAVFICALVGARVASTDAAPQLRTYALAPYSGVDQKTAASGPLESARAGSGDNGSGTARAFADFGVLKLFAESHAANTGSMFGLMQTGGQASFQDTVSIDAPGKTGSSGTLVVQFTVDGTLTCSAGGWDGSRESQTDAEFVLTAAGWTILQAEYIVYFDGRSSGTAFLGKVQTATINFIFGTPFDLKLYISTAASAYTFRGADAIGDLENTATWGGFVSVKDSNGAEVSDYTATSVSGANYVAAITPPAPRLAIQELSPNMAQISWSTNFGGYALQSANSLSLPNWSIVTNGVTTNGTSFNVSVPMVDRQRYFRLKRQ
jgi:hypothetical protein